MSEKKPIEIAMPRLVEQQEVVKSTCCFCIPLKIACFTLGYLTLLINMFNTLVIVGAILMLNVLTEGFRAVHTRFAESGQMVEDIDPVLQSSLNYMLLVTGFMLLLNAAWLCWNVFLLVSLHKKRPGSIKVNMSIICVRFVLMVIALATMTGPSNSTDYIIMTCTEISITGYFIIVYHAYATQLERSQKAKIRSIETTLPSEIAITDVYFAYPKVLDKQHLVEKEKY